MSNWVDGLHIGILTVGRFSIEEQMPDATSPPNVDIAHFYGQIVDAHGNAAPNVRVMFSIACPPACQDHIAITSAVVDTYTNEYGQFEADLLKGVPYKIMIDDVGLYMAFTVPNGANIINLLELIYC